jgi:hypothetical protein
MFPFGEDQSRRAYPHWQQVGIVMRFSIGTAKHKQRRRAL